MVQDFDYKSFLSNIKATKPPYLCPFERCQKIYKTYIGMRFHLYNFDHLNGRQLTETSNPESARKRGGWHHRSVGRSPSPPDFLKGSNREALTYAEAQRLVEVDIDGKVHRININEPLDIIHLDTDSIDSPLNGSVISLNNSIIDNNVKTKKSCSEVQPTTPTNGPTGAKNAKTGKGKNRSGKCGKGRKEINSKQTTSPNEKKNHELVLKLPEPSFRVIEGYDPPDAKPRTSSYYRYIEKTIDDIDEEVEYDMDEEDTAWLDLVNKKRRDDRLPEVPADTFELLMDRLEKESYFQSQNSGKDVGPAIDEDAVCCICNDGECQNSNAILFCDMCNLAVHQECYGVPYIPEGQWLCRRCLQSPSRAVDCVLCPNKGGAFKQTDDNRWSHVVCALWIPEVCFANTVFLEPIDSIGNIPSARWKLSCYICKQRGVGACIQCHKANCYVAFHVTCAQQAGLYMKMEAVKEMTSSGLVTNVKKAAYCDAHTPTDENGVVLSGVYSSGEEDSRSDNQKVKQTKAKFKEKMKKARKILAEKRSAIPVVSVPTIPLERLTKIAALINIPKRNQFLQRLLGYWTLKRQSRNGVPLLRRLQISHNNLRKDSHKDGDDAQVIRIREQLKCMNRLRQDLERVRLLVELIRKREKIKRENLRIHENTVELQLNPFKLFLITVLGRLEDKDTNKYFAEPVSVEDVPDYREFIKNPMDFSSIRAKLMRNEYNSYESFVKDFKLIISNCTEYNTPDTVWHRAALRLSDQCQSILNESKKLSEIYNPMTGLHSQLTSNEIQVCSVANICQSERRQLEHKLKELEESLVKAKSQKSGGSRTKRVRSLTAEIANIKDKIESKNSSQGLSTTGHHMNMSALTVGSFVSSNSSPNKRKQKSPKTKIMNSFNSDSDETDIICENNSNNISNLIDKIEGRKTYNSVSASIISTTDIEGLIKSNSSPNKPNSTTNQKESLKKRSKSNTKNNKLINNKKDNTKVTNSRTNNKRKVNGSPFTGSLSPNSLASNSSAANLGDIVSEKNSSLRKKGQNSKLIDPKALTADASTLTANNMFTETAESFAREQAIRGQTGGSKRRSNRSSSSRPNKRQQTSSSSLRLIDSQIPFPITQTESFSVYRNMNSTADSDAVSESSQSHTSSGSSKSSGSTGTTHSESSLSSLGSSGTSSRVSARTKRESPRRPRSRSSRSDVSAIENQKIPLQPNDLVWAKCSGYPWYPALIVNPDSTDLGPNGIPIPPNDVLAIGKRDDKHNQYLVSFFDQKRTWQWLPRNKLEPLAIEPNTDDQKKNESRKPSDRKAVQKAYTKALEFFANRKNL